MHNYLFKTYLLFVVSFLILYSCDKEKEIRQDISLNKGWYTAANDTNQFAYNGFQNKTFECDNWLQVDVPHNWDDYGGYRRMRHGNRHGYAWYRKTFNVEKPISDKCYFLFFEGVGSYATVWLNGDSVGYHAGGRTTFTLDVTSFVHLGSENSLAVRVDHPANIRDLPWVCGGCSPEWGFCEGSQPMGIFRPVHFIETNSVRIEPFGVHIWNDNQISNQKADLHLITEVKNYGNEVQNIKLKNSLKNKAGKEVISTQTEILLKVGQSDTFAQSFVNIQNPHLWSLDDPYLYELETEIWIDGKCFDRIKTPYGIRTIQWDIFGEGANNRFYLNSKPIFLNGTAEYEHLFGQGHAFSDEQIESRVDQVKAMGFNAFRDGHQPHNLRYQQAWDKDGILWWPQMSAHIWFDNPEFRKNFKILLADWVKERRNSPSIILWGLENESTLPEDFAKECADLIRQLDPTASSQRLVTTCNGGVGTDWNVVQNWSGTYGGNPENYANELSVQLLNGEYGAWRSLGLHTEGGFEQRGIYSEDRINLLMESKIRLGEQAADKSCGQFHWLMASHDNPGRTQSGEGMRDIDRVGPVNYKGAMTIWGEPLDLFYLFRSNYVSKETEPMVYIVSHTWPDRWTTPGIKSGVRVFTNCDEVELFNGVKENSLGRKKRGAIGTHIVFDSIDVQNNLLYVVGYVNGRAVADDQVLLNHLPKASGVEKLAGKTELLTKGNQNYLYRVNCGGSDYTDKQGNLWMADVHQTDKQHWGSRSWTDDYEGMPAYYGSQRFTNDPISGTTELPLIQTFRYGRHKLSYHFPVSDGKYKVELFFIEPWYGTGGGLECSDWRVFDVAVNGKVFLDDLDIWAEVGHDHLLKKTVSSDIIGGELKISFPQVKSAQAVISAIAISTNDLSLKPSKPSPRIISSLNVSENGWVLKTWMDTGVDQYTDEVGQFYALSPELYGTEWIQSPSKIKEEEPMPSFKLSANADVIIGIDTTLIQFPGWLSEWQPMEKYIASTFNGGTQYQLYQKQVNKDEVIQLKRLRKEKFIMYPVAVVPVTLLDDPIDLRKATEWQAENGKQWGNASKLVFANKPCVKVNDQNGTVGLSFQVGLASKYGLELRFMNWAEEELPVNVEIVAADGRMMWSGEWIFPATPKRWKTYRNDTQTTINAGTYTIKFTPKEKGPLFFDWFKVQ